MTITEPNDSAGTAAATRRPVSPQSTGGAGYGTEYRLGAVALAALLCGDSIPGLQTPVERVAFQQRPAGHPLDDVVLQSTSGSGEPLSVDFQSKQDLRPTPGTADFLESIKAAVNTIRGDPEGTRLRRHQVGLASEGPRNQLEELQKVAQYAEGHADADAFWLLMESGDIGQPITDRLEHLRATVEQAMRDLDGAEPDAGACRTLTWQLAHCLVVWIAEVHPEGRDVSRAIGRLDDVFGSGRGSSMFAEILELAVAWDPVAAVVDVQMLRAALDRRGVGLAPHGRGRVAYEALRSATVGVLATGNDRIAGDLDLERAGSLEELVQSAREHRCSLVTGKAGAGKSVLARRMMRGLETEGLTVAAVTLSAGMSSTDLDAALGARIEDALPAGPTGCKRVLLVDGAEQALVDGRALLRRLITSLPTGDGGLAWNIVVVCRDEAAPAVSQELKTKFETISMIRIGDLTEPEVDQILERFPILNVVARHPRPRALLLHRPYLVDLLVRAGRDLEGLLGEEDVVDVVAEQLVRMSGGTDAARGAPSDRVDAYLGLGDAVIADAVPSLLSGYSGVARDGLVLDDIFAHEALAFRFAHDVLADYAVTSRLGTGMRGAALDWVGAPRRIIRSIRLHFQVALSQVRDDHGALIAVFEDSITTADALAQRDGPRWRSVPYEALLLSGPAPALIHSLASAWLASGASEHFQRLLTVARRLALPLVEFTELAAGVDMTVTGPVVDTLALLGAQIPDTLRPGAQQLLYTHLTALDAEQLGPDGAIAESAPGLIEALQQWGRTPGPNDERIACLLLLAAHLTDGQQAELLAEVRDDPSPVGEAIETPPVAAAMACWRPELLLALAGCYYLGQELFLDPGRPPVPCGRRPQSRLGWMSGDEDGIREHVPGMPLASATKGPFSHLLASSAPAGLRLIGSLVDTATNSRERTEAGFGGGASTISLTAPTGETRTYHGTADVWCWYRASTVGPYPALSALLALHEWARGEVQHRTVSDIVNDILGCGQSLAFVAVAWAVLAEHPTEAGNLVDAFLTHPLLWHFETGRIVHEGSILVPPLPEGSRLSWRMDEIAMEFVIEARADDERKLQLKALGQQLVANIGEVTHGLDGEVVENERLVLRRWAAVLDHSLYRAELHEETGRIAITVDPPDDVVSGLAETGGRRAAEMLALHGLAFEAAKLRDVEDDQLLATDDASTLFERARQMWQIEDDPDSPLSVWDTAAGAAAVQLRRAALGMDVSDEDVLAATDIIFRLLESMPANGPHTDEVRDMLHDWGADRSAAVAMPLLLNAALRARSGVDLDEVKAALLVLASSPFAEVRSRLVTGLLPFLMPSTCSGPAHGVALAVLEELIRTSGLGPWDQYGRRPRLRLPGLTLENMSAETMDLNVAGAGDAIAGLVAMERGDCEHAITAHTLLNVLLDYDRLVWPVHLARHNYSGLGRWRIDLDRIVADRALDGDAHDLERHLDAFATVPEELIGVLQQLAARADTQARGVAVHDLWPGLMDRLLPSNRPAEDWSSSDGHANWRDMEELDRALLLAPTEVRDWPWDRTWALLLRWVAEFKNRPHVADRLMKVLALLGLLYSQSGTTLVTAVLGDDAKRIDRESSLAVYWLRIVFLERPDVIVNRPALLILLDNLALGGDLVAIALQMQMEA